MLWADFCLASEGDGAVEDSGKEGRKEGAGVHRGLLLQPSRRPTGSPDGRPFYRGEDNASERGLLAKCQPTREKRDHVTQVSLLQSPFSLSPATSQGTEQTLAKKYRKSWAGR